MGRLKAAERRSQLIEAATRVFARRGYDATTTAALAQAAGVTEPILYRHFKGKRELFMAIVREVSQISIKRWRTMTEGIADPTERLRVIARNLPEHIRTLDNEYRVLLGALAMSRDAAVRQVLREHYDQIERFLSESIIDGQQAGFFHRNLDPKAAAWQLIFSGIGYAMIWLNLGPVDRVSMVDVVQTIVDGWREGGVKAENITA